MSGETLYNAPPDPDENVPVIHSIDAQPPTDPDDAPGRFTLTGDELRSPTLVGDQHVVIGPDGRVEKITAVNADGQTVTVTIPEGQGPQLGSGIRDAVYRTQPSGQEASYTSGTRSESAATVATEPERRKPELLLRGGARSDVDRWARAMGDKPLETFEISTLKENANLKALLPQGNQVYPVGYVVPGSRAEFGTAAESIEWLSRIVNHRHPQANGVTLRAVPFPPSRTSDGEPGPAGLLFLANDLTSRFLSSAKLQEGAIELQARINEQLVLAGIDARLPALPPEEQSTAS